MAKITAITTMVTDFIGTDTVNLHTEMVRGLVGGQEWNTLKVSKAQVKAVKADPDVQLAALKSGNTIDSYIARLGDASRIVKECGGTAVKADKAVAAFNLKRMLDGKAPSYSLNSNGIFYKSLFGTPTPTPGATVADRIADGKLDDQLATILAAITARQAVKVGADA